MLKIEEQRTYIEVLKQALENKMGDIGLGPLIQKFKNEGVDIFLELQNLQQQEEYYRQEHHKLQ